MPMLTLARGLPGSGKSSLAKSLARKWKTDISWDSRMVAADDFRLDENGEYFCDPKDTEAMNEAHRKCQEAVRNLLERKVDCVVHNTFIRHWELEPYRKLAKEYGYQLRVITVHDPALSNEDLSKRCEHGVPPDAIADMRSRFQFEPYHHR